MAPISGLNLQKGSNGKSSFAASSQMFVDSLSKVFWITDSTSVIATSVSNGALCLTNVICLTTRASKYIEQVHGIASEMKSQLKSFI